MDNCRFDFSLYYICFRLRWQGILRNLLGCNTMGAINFVRGLIYKITYKDKITNGARKYSPPTWFIPSNIVLAIILISFISVYIKDYKTYQNVRNNSITIEMDKEAIKEIMGDPDSVENHPAINEEIWKYDDLTITFNNEGVVKEWHKRSNNSSSYMGDKAEDAVIKIGSSKEDVIRAAGIPDSVNQYRYQEEMWHYKRSSVTFNDKGLVRAWYNISDNLPVYMGDKVEGAVFKIGSSEEDVIRAMGTPNSISKRYISDEKTWVYENSTVTFNNDGFVKGWNDASNNLSIDKGD